MAELILHLFLLTLFMQNQPESFRTNSVYCLLHVEAESCPVVAVLGRFGGAHLYFSAGCKSLDVLVPGNERKNATNED